MKDQYDKNQGQDAKQLDRAAEIRSDAAEKANKDVQKADAKFAKNEGEARHDLQDDYRKAAKETDRDDANKDLRDARTDFQKADIKAAEKQQKGYRDAADEIGEKAEARAKNRDPLTDAPKSHPVGTGVGTLGGAVAGAAAGSVGGPIGTAVGGVVGGIIGAAAGHGIGEAVNPTIEEAYWKSAYGKEPYYNNKYTYDDYAPAYRTGFMARNEYRDLPWDQAEPKLASVWERTRGSSRLQWDEARAASRAAWNRASQSKC